MREEKQEWSTLELLAVISVLQSDAKVGLTEEEAKKRLQQYGTNTFGGKSSKTIFDRLLAQLRSPLAYILLSAGIVTLMIGHSVDSIVICTALFVNICLGMYQEGRANRAFEHLRKSQVRYANVLRDGIRSRISAEGLVPGDVIELTAGSAVPADARILASSNMMVNESALTGEWAEVTKVVATLKGALPVSEQGNMLWMGTLMTAGNATAIVVETGGRTVVGQLAQYLSHAIPPPTPLEGSIRALSRTIAGIVGVALVLISVIGAWRGLPLEEILMIAISVAVAAIPEGLPAAVTVVLAIGMEAILKRGGLVKNLLAAETLGSTTVILIDKTGTLTLAEMRIRHVVTSASLDDPKHDHSERAEHHVHGDEQDVLRMAMLASDAFLDTKASTEEIPVVVGRPVERAILLAGIQSGVALEELAHRYQRVDFSPFQSEVRFSASLDHILGISAHRIFVTGAPEALIPFAHSYYEEGTAHELTSEMRAKYVHAEHHLADEGMRIIGVGYRDVERSAFSESERTHPEEILSSGFVFAGLIALHDPIRHDVHEVITQARKAGARVIMVTGDAPKTAHAIALEAGIAKKNEKVYTGLEIEQATDEELLVMLNHSAVFARVLPKQKLRLSRVLQKEEEVVAMTGDGVNDAPALQNANIGIALGSGTEVAKESADIVLLDDSFSVILGAIEEGRRIHDNIRKIVAYLLSTAGSEVILVGGALLLNFPLPLLPVQILWTNLLSEGLMTFAFAFEPPAMDLMRRNPKKLSGTTVMNTELKTFILLVGVLSGLFLVAMNVLLLSVGGMSVEIARTYVFIALSLGTILSAFSIKDMRERLTNIPFFSNWYLIGAFLSSIGLLCSALFFAPLRHLLSLAPLTLHAVPIVVGIIVVTLAILEGSKWWVFGRHRR